MAASPPPPQFHKMPPSSYSITSSGGRTMSDRYLESSEGSDIEKVAVLPPKSPENPLFKPKTAKFWLILLSNFLALFLVALDRTIVATAVPRITDEFHSLGDIGWYASAYMLTTSASQLLFGRIYKFYNMKWCVVKLGDGAGQCPKEGII
jgi:hypothetical protein